ncbi:L,D-transpeptidase [Terrihabitans sp. B22-R8]|uniref:L,D-transpeptidase n=1 Tax=Terrihabitans sp. B22-R8 TaxID=3425128 RepID=UPI00403C6182
MTSISGRAFTRRLFLAGLAGSLAACQQTTASAPKPQVSLPPEFAELYGPLPDEPFPIPGVPIGAIKPDYLRKQVVYATNEPPGTIVVDPGAKYLYLVQDGGMALRYGVGVGREGFGWSGAALIQMKREWPRWTPPAEMIKRQPELEPYRHGMAAGLENPLGARALYLFQNGRDTLYRLHGTNEPRSIGSNVSSGCVRLVNQDIIDLYSRTPLGTRVIVLPTAAQA